MHLPSKTTLFTPSLEEVENDLNTSNVDSDTQYQELESDASNMEQEVVTIENNINRLNNILEAQDAAIQQLDDAQLYNRSTHEVEENISEDTVAVVREHLIYSLGQLGYKYEDLKYINYSKEEYSAKQRVELSLEGFIDTIKDFFKKIIDIIVKVGKQLGIWITKFSNFMGNEKKAIDNINVFCHDNNGIKWNGFNEKNTGKIQRMLGAILLVTNGKLDYSQIIEYYTTNTGNPFARRLQEVYKLTNIPESSSDEQVSSQKQKLLEDIKKESSQNDIHKGLIELIEKQENVNCYYVSIIKGEDIKYYGSSKDQNYKYGLPISYNKCKITNRNSMSITLAGVNSYGDIPNVSKRLYEISRRHNEYFNTILKLNKDAMNLVKKLRDDILKENEIDQSIKIVLKRNLSFLQSLGTSLAFDASFQYGYLTKTLVNILQLAIKQKTDNSVENRINAPSSEPVKQQQKDDNKNASNESYKWWIKK